MNVARRTPIAEASSRDRSAEAVIVVIESGRDLGRAPLGAPATMGMFLCPGFGRHFYAATPPGTIARIHVA